jgi:putative endopeptidase
LQKKYGEYFAACMNIDLADTLGAKPIAPVLAAIDGLSDKKQLAALSVELQKRYGNSAIFNVGVQQDQVDSTKQILGTGQGGLTLPDRDYYIADDERMKTIRTQYVAHMEKMFVLLGDSEEKAKAEAASVMKIETALAQGSMSRRRCLRSSTGRSIWMGWG